VPAHTSLRLSRVAGLRPYDESLTRLAHGALASSTVTSEPHLHHVHTESCADERQKRVRGCDEAIRRLLMVQYLKEETKVGEIILMVNNGSAEAKVAGAHEGWCKLT
jgi:hypothetical protein